MGLRSKLPKILLPAVLGAVVAVPAAFATTTPQALPFTQDWANNGMITANDDWSGVAGIQGFLGQDLTVATGTDPQTILTGASGLAGDLTVLANQTATTATNGDVGEFHTTSQAGADGANSTVALQGSGTADAPHIILYLDTTAKTNIVVAYNLRDIDCTADNSQQQVALQYRIGNSGSFINVPAGYVSDATTGPSLCTQVTPISVGLPAAVDNQAEVDVRIMSTNAAGNDEWLGIDDVSVNSTTTAVALKRFSATRSAKGAVVRWNTGTEVDTLGFNVIRAGGGATVKLNRSLILASTSGKGASYRFGDGTAKPGVKYTYRLQAVSLRGAKSFLATSRLAG